MSTFIASTPQLKAVKNVVDAWTSLNLGKANALISKNYQYEVFHVATDLAKLDNERHAEAIQRLFAGMNKLDVSTQQRRTVFDPTD